MKFMNLLERGNSLEIPKKEETLEVVFKEVATDLLSNYGLCCGEDLYYFAEIEFYFRSPTHNKDFIHDNEEGAERATDQRLSGKWYHHYSGVDITFGNEEKLKERGGILIRSLKVSGHDEFIVGPLKCSNAIFGGGSIFSGKQIEIKKLSTQLKDLEVKCMPRHNLGNNGDEKYRNLCYRFAAYTDSMRMPSHVRNTTCCHESE
jgi:hypothetical protein